jgi:DNA helicase II / ATP-dependent DNA helicase PcrA
MNDNRLIIASAGSGKTTYIIDEALKYEKGKLLITTYTQANESEIKKNIIQKFGCIPDHINIQTWFSFLLQHGVRPYQGHLYDKTISGMILVNEQSAVKYYTRTGIPVCFKEEEDFGKHYLTKDHKVYSDKLAKLVVRENEISDGAVIDRLSRIYSAIFIDEVQDLAGYDLEIIKLFLKSPINTFLVGDPRQVTYLTHHERKYLKYTNGLIKEFIETECNKTPCTIDDKTLTVSHRNNSAICSLSSKLYPSLPISEPGQKKTTNHDGIYLVRPKDITNYIQSFSPVQLRLNKDSKGIVEGYTVLNFGESKGLSFDRVLIFPTKDMRKWIANNDTPLTDKTRAQLYVGITRARYSVGIVYDYDDKTEITGITQFKPET